MSLPTQSGLQPVQSELEPTPPRDSSQPDSGILIAGAGIVGLALALELHCRGVRVTVLEAGRALRQASRAAAGMLAVHDPHNPPELLPLAEFSAALYPAFLDRIEALSGCSVPFQTEATIQHLSDGRTTRLPERSLDPRQLGAALLAAVRATSHATGLTTGRTTGCTTGIDLREDTPLQSAQLQSTHQDARGITAVTATGERFHAGHLIYATGAWALPARLRVPIAPRKGQMLRVQLPSHAPLHEVHRSEHIYIVPRTHGPQPGTALIGATVEDAGFNTEPHARDLARLRALAAELLPELADETDAPLVEAWAGLRPFAPDALPLLGRIGNTPEWIASGHFRNGILLAPATAVVIADLIEGNPPALDLSPFAPQRFS